MSPRPTTDLRDHSAEQEAEQMPTTEARYRSIFEAIDDGFCVIEFIDGPHGPLSDYVHVEANDAYARITGIANVVGRNVRDVFPDEADGWIATFIKVLRTGEPARFERELIAVGQHLELSAFRIEPVSRKQVAVLFKDVTARRKAEVELRELTMRLDALVRSSTEVRYLINADWSELAELSGGGFLADTPAGNANWLNDYIPPEGRDAVRAEFERAIKARDTYRIDHPVYLANGSVGWAQVQAVPLFDEAGEITHWYGAASNITERRKAEAELHELATELSHLNGTLEAQVTERTAERDRVWRLSRDMLGVADTQGRWTSVNPAWSRILGWSENMFIGRTSEWLEHPEDHVKTRAEVARLAAGLETAAFENRFRHQDGTYRWLSWTAAPENDLLYCAGRDVTAEKERQIELDAAQDQLRQAQKVEAVGQLTGGVAHDFNNLLTVIRGSVDLLRRPNLTDERRDRYIQAIAETADRAAKLTNQLLAFARRQALLPESFDAEESILVLADMVRTLSGSRIDVALESASCPCHIHADRNQFDTAIINMAVNARDAMNGEGHLIIRVESVDGMPSVRSHPAVAGDFIAISLTDTGEGISADRIDHIFEPFFTTKDVGKGTGLGLSQVFGFAKQSGGEVMVVSEVGTGTTFTLYLPRILGEQPAIVRDIAPREVATGDGACILVVEDNPQVGEFARSALAELGYTTVLAKDAAHALGELEAAADRFDVVFSDVVMPGMSGIELGQEIRIRHPGLPVVLTSGYSNVLAQDGNHGFELIHKPYSIDQLSSVLHRIISPR
ncbi:PAS domain S-box protein [Sphingomonas sp. Leaf205]|uniref:PAS domain S-box protein n=1 Tax=Sphingomonas sp. Leaf205 TaxID=2876551 RepID=UPI001E53CA10|nr:PAS domain S-box protein [Sphingomonas sp. Leaf205]